MLKWHTLNMTTPQAEHIRPYRVTARRMYTWASSRAASRTPDEVHQQSEQCTPKPPPPAHGPRNILLFSAK